MNERVPFEENVACDVCGRFGAFAIGNRHLCEDCYEAQGSCCMEFGGDDLWRISEQQEGGEQSPKREPTHPQSEQMDS